MNEWLLENPNAFNAGVNSASQGMNLQLRRQQLESERALRQMQQEHIAQQMQLSIQKEQDKIQEQADFAKAHTSFLHDISPVVDLDPASPNGVVQNPNAMPMDKAVLKNFSGPMAKWHPDKFGSFLDDAAMLPYRQAAAKKAADWTAIETAKEQGRTDRFVVGEQGKQDRAQLNADTKLTLEDMRGQWHQDVAHITAQSRLDAIKQKFEQDSLNGKLSPALAAHYLDDIKPEEKRLNVMIQMADKRMEDAQRSFDPEQIKTAKTALRRAQLEYDEGVKKIADTTSERMIRLALKPNEEGGQTAPGQPNDSDVRVRTKEGKVGTIKKSKLPEALKRGATLLE